MKIPSVSMHLRMPPSLIARLKDQASQHHRSVAAEILTIIEDAMATPPPKPQPVAQSISPVPTTSGRVTNADQLLSTIRQAIERQGVDVETEHGIRRMVPSDVVRAMYYQSRIGRYAATSNQSAYYAGIDKLTAWGAIFRFDGKIGINPPER